VWDQTNLNLDLSSHVSGVAHNKQQFLAASFFLGPHEWVFINISHLLSFPLSSIEFFQTFFDLSKIIFRKLDARIFRLFYTHLNSSSFCKIQIQKQSVLPIEAALREEEDAEHRAETDVASVSRSVGTL